MLFEQRLQQGLVDGSIRIAFRRWKRPQVASGRRYRSPIGLVQVDRIDRVDGAVSEADAEEAGYRSIAALLDDLKGAADGDLYRLELHRVDGTDPREELAHQAKLTAGDVLELQRRLERLDRHRVWTTSVLRAIDEHPATRAAEVAAMLGWSDLLDFKQHVRKLKGLGLTISLERGYRLSPRGEAYLAALGGD